MHFLNRSAELATLREALSRKRRQFIVLFGRRRCGKSTLLRQLPRERTCYFLATEGEPALQRALLAARLAERHPGFALAAYPHWASLLESLIARGGPRYTLVLDELPYLLKSSPELASTLQALLEDRERLPFDLVVCGSSQQMMDESVLSASAPLYGRADEIVRVEPLRAGYLREKFPNLSSRECVGEYAVWGGVPRYWELRDRYGSRVEAIRRLLLEPTGLLRDEPQRLLRDDLTHLASPISLLTLVANGAHRVSEIGGRLGKTSADLTRPLQRLSSLGYVGREVPYGESPRRSKRTLYHVRDPFMRFYYRFIDPEASRIEAGRADEVGGDIAEAMSGFVGETWERLCRRSVRFGALGKQYDDCRRWWGTTNERRPVEIDGVSRSRDRGTLLLMECKWSDGVDVAREAERLRRLAPTLPFYEGEAVKTVIATKDAGALSPERVLAALR